MDNDILNKRTKGIWFHLPHNDKGKQIPILTDAADETVVCFIGIKGQPNEANAVFICKAVNEHDKLIEDNKLLLEALSELISAGQEALDYKDGSGKQILQEAIWKHAELTNKNQTK